MEVKPGNGRSYRVEASTAVEKSGSRLAAAAAGGDPGATVRFLFVVSENMAIL